MIVPRAWLVTQNFLHGWRRSSTAEMLLKSQGAAVELPPSSLIPYRMRSEWLLSPENSDFPKNEADLLTSKEKSGKNSAWEPFCSGYLACAPSASEIESSKSQKCPGRCFKAAHCWNGNNRTHSCKLFQTKSPSHKYFKDLIRFVRSHLNIESERDAAAHFMRYFSTATIKFLMLFHILFFT